MVVGPAVVFFLWLSFAVVGGGDINTEIAGSSAVPETAKISGQDAAGIGGIMDWNKMSNFAIAIGGEQSFKLDLIITVFLGVIYIGLINIASSFLISFIVACRSRSLSWKQSLKVLVGL